jgi:choline-sulfatase
MDRKLGQLLDVLEETGMLENTVVIYTSDHGDMHGKFGMWWKCSLYEDSARVPLIAAGPGFKKNFRDMTAVNALDVQASIFKALGCDRPADWIGTPLQELAPNDEEKVAFSEYHGHGTRASGFMVRKGMWKYLYYSQGPNQLFNLADDPNELTNLIAKYPDTSKEMEKELRKICDPDVENKRAEDYIQKELAALEKANLKIMPGGIAFDPNS